MKPHGRPTRRTRDLRVVAAAIAVLVACSVSTGWQGAVSASAAGLPVVGHLPMSPDVSTTVGGDETRGFNSYSANDMLLLDPPHRRGYELVAWVNGVNGGSVPETEITVYNLDTLAVLGRGLVDGVEPVGASSGTGVPGGVLPTQGFVAALTTDEAQPHLIFAVYGASAITRPGVQPYDILEVDLTTFQVTADVSLGSPSCLQNDVPTRCPVYGLSYDPRSHLTYALAATSWVGFLGAQTVQFAVDAVDLHSGTVTSAALPTSCNQQVSNNGQTHAYQDPIFRSTDGSSLWTLCGLSGNGLAYPVFAAVQVPLAPSGLPQSAPARLYPSGYLTVIDAFADPADDRMTFNLATAGDQSLLVFDGRHASYVGTAGLAAATADGPYLANQITETGMDPTSGRAYVFSLHGAYLVDTRRTDVRGFPQASVFPTQRPGGYGVGGGVAFDPVTRHVFTRLATEPSGGGTSTADLYYTVFQDNVPVSQDVPLAGLDANTANIPSRPGSTTSIYAGHAQGFGTRSYQLHFSQVPTSTTANPVPNSDVIEAAATSVGGTGGADLTATGASAVGSTLDADERTRKQYAQTAQQFPYTAHSCGDSSGAPTAGGSNGEPGGSTQESCDLLKGTAQVTSSYRASDASSTLPATSPSESDITTTVAYDATHSTVVSTATATVRGIQLGPGVGVSYLQVTATSVAGGRSGTANAKVTVVMRGVTAPGYDCPANCDPATALQQINSALAQELPGQVQVVFPLADATAAKGTPHGYYSALIKDTYQLLNDQTLYSNGRPELAGLEEIRNGSGTEGGLTDIQITDYAGVEVESRFGITPLDLGFPIVGSGVITAGTSTPGTPGSAGQFVPGTPAGQGSANTGATGGARSGNGGPLAAIVNGLAFLLDWTQLPLMSLMWIVLLLPAYLATRRQRLEALAL